jgi:hypothetical protein
MNNETRGLVNKAVRCQIYEETVSLVSSCCIHSGACAGDIYSDLPENYFMGSGE